MEPPIQQESVKVYIPGFCWHGLPGKIFKICGMQAGHYIVFRCNKNMPDSKRVFMWLCGKHKKDMEKQDYTVVPYKA